MYTLPHFNSGLLLHGRDAPIHQNKRLDDRVTLCRNGRRCASRAEQQLQTQPGSSATVSRHQGQRQIRFSGPVSDSSRRERLDTVTSVPSSSAIPATGPDLRGPHLQLRQEPQGSSDFRLRSQGPCRLGTGESGLVLG